MICPSCQAANDDGAEACFTCGKALFALTQGILLGGRYEILRPLGMGGMGRVYKAHDRILDEAVAIKLLRPELTRDDEMTRRFRSEIKLARRVSHPNVCRIHEYSQDGELAYISMEYIDGRNLKEYLETTQPTPAEGFELCLQIAQGLRAVHDHGIIHRDFKASNIMVDGQGVVKLMDFGIAKDADMDTTGYSGSGVLGTPEYMSPEQGAGGKVDFRSDVYSLGCVIFEIFAGRPPFRADTPLATLYKHQNEPPPLDSSRIPDSLIPVLRSALAKDPRRRYESVSDLIAALRTARRATDASPRTSETTTLNKRPRPFASRMRAQAGRRLWPWAAVAIASLGVVAAVATGLQSKARRPGSAPSSVPKDAPSISPPPTLPAPSPKPVPRTVATPAPASTVAAERSRAIPPPTVPATMPRASPTPPGPERGTLTLVIVPEADVVLDGEPLGRLSMKELSLEAGTHTVRVLHPDYEPLQRRVTVHAGLGGRLVLELAEKGIPRRR